MKSRFFSSLALKGINKVGDAFIPGDGEFPSFSELGVVEHVDQIAEDIPPGDLDGLKILFAVFGVLPGFLLKMLFIHLEWHFKTGFMMTSLSRQIRFGMRGIVFSLYYSGLKGSQYKKPDPLQLLGFELNVKT